MKILTVSELTLAIKKTLEPQFAHLQVKGEVTNLRQQSSGHLYFSLKDQDSQISAVLFKGSAQKLPYLPKSGDQVVVRGELSLYAPRGSYQIIVRDLERAGVGELLMKLHQLKEELKGRGWLSPECKKPLPKYPKTIGVVTSPTGSVIQDIIHVLKRRFPQFHLILNPVKVQGPGAAEEIAAAIKEFNTHSLVDVMIVGRGGGSLEDLWPFNEECVAEAIFHSKIPIISAVGHETDVTLADCVADMRAPTPSAAAEISVREQTAQMEFLTQTIRRLDHYLKQHLRHAKSLLSGISRHPLLASPYAMLAEHYQRVDDFSNNLDTAIKHKISKKNLELMAFQRELQGYRPIKQIEYLKGKLQTFSERFEQGIKQITKQKKESLKYLSEHLNALNPKSILKKGYCIPFAEKTHSVMMSSRVVDEGMHISLQFHDGTILTKALEVHSKND